MKNRTILPLTAVAWTSATLLWASDPACSVGISNGDIATSVIDTAIKSLGPLAILGWYLWYDKSKSQPRRDQETREEREGMAKLYEARIDRIIDASIKQGEAASASLRAQAESFAECTRRMADVHEKMIENCSRARSIEVGVQ